MKIAHLIITHKNPDQLERLLVALEHPAFDFFIQLDKKSDINQFIHLEERKNVFFIRNRTKVYWAAFGLAQATINGLREIVNLRLDYDYINVISAQDFPLKSSKIIYQFISDRKGKEFITYESVEKVWTEALPRIRNYHFVNWRIPGKYKLEKLANFLLPKRKFPLEYEIVGRSNWFALTAKAAEYIVTFLDKNPKVLRFFKYTWGADELIFSTILHNSQYKENVIPNLLYIDWEGQKNGHPKILTIEDHPKILASDKLFARKFDTEIDLTIIEMLEEQIKKGN